jgi:hypothetical protein
MTDYRQSSGFSTSRSSAISPIENNHMRTPSGVKNNDNRNLFSKNLPLDRRVNSLTLLGMHLLARAVRWSDAIAHYHAACVI